MISIPDTGPGLSGFLAHYLWLVYAHFPSTGRWDWLLLFLALGAAVHSACLPYLWKAVEANMADLRQEKARYFPRSGYWASVFCGTSLGFFLWFFDTPAGRTFLDGRQLFGDMLGNEFKHSPPLPSFVIVFPLTTFFMLFFLSLHLCLDGQKRAKATGAKKTQPFPSHDFYNLYNGGGFFVDFNTRSQEPQYNVPIPFFYLALGCDCLAFIPVGFFQGRQLIQTNIALILLDCFLFFALITEMFRILFVYILHKRTFGRTRDGRQLRLPFSD